MCFTHFKFIFYFDSYKSETFYSQYHHLTPRYPHLHTVHRNILATYMEKHLGRVPVNSKYAVMKDHIAA